MQQANATAAQQCQTDSPPTLRPPPAAVLQLLEVRGGTTQMLQPSTFDLHAAQPPATSLYNGDASQPSARSSLDGATVVVTVLPGSASGAAVTERSQPEDKQSTEEPAAEQQSVAHKKHVLAYCSAAALALAAVGLVLRLLVWQRH